MPQHDQKSSTSRDALIQGLNEDLAREYQAIIAYVTYSKVLKGAQYMNIADELEKHAGEELQHALTVAEQIDYLGGTPVVQPKPVKVTDDNEEMLRADLANEVATIQNYRVRIHQCEDLQEYAMAELLREILTQEQDHLIALATALGIDAPRVDAVQPSESSEPSHKTSKQTSAGR
jgi:bacterioferritin